MPFDVVSGSVPDRLRPASRMPGLNQAERETTAHFARLLRAELARPPGTEGGAMLLLVGLPAELRDATARLVPAADAAASIAPGEVAVAWVLQGVPRCPGRRKVLALRLASAGGAAWRQHRHVERLGLLAA